MSADRPPTLRPPDWRDPTTVVVVVVVGALLGVAAHLAMWGW